MASAHNNGQDIYDVSEEEEEEMSAFLSAGHLASAYALPMTLKAVIELGVLDIIANAGPPGTQLSPSEIASKISDVTNPQAAVINLDRILRYLASSSVLTCSVVEGDGGVVVERKYGLTPVCKFFVTRPDGASLAPLVLLDQEKLRLDPWRELKFAVLDGVIPFKKINGVTCTEYLGADPKLSSIFNKGMSGTAALLLKKLLNGYTGFQGIGTLVDIGGGIGKSLEIIISKYPQITGINFDLPHVVADAPPIAGVKHVGGDMFKTIPSGDAIFMKWVLHVWNDEDCLKILKNCFKALPSTGKVIIVDFVIPEAPEEDAINQIKFYGDLCMLNYFDGKERTKEEFQSLGKKAGFSKVDIVSCSFGIQVIELRK